MIRWGILGCGRIAGKFASDLKLVQNAELVACGARSKESADEFASTFSVKHAHYSYEALVKDKEVDVIYVATPHSHHHEHTLLCIENNKAVLCEKAFAINYRQAKEMIDTAHSKKVFLMEAVWTKFLAPFKKVKEMIDAGTLGEIKSMQLNFGFRPPKENAPQRIYDPLLGGGTVLDIGIYNIFTTLYFLGKPDNIEATMTPASTGIDAQCATTFSYNNGAIAQLFSTFLSDTSTEADICGTEGRIRLTARYYTPFTTIEYYTGKPDTKKIISLENEEGFGYQYEASHVCECLEKGLTESNVMSHADTLLLMETMDAVRSKAGIIYSADK